jgi:EmrB/QacA subfamily drug resistance transporter
VDDARRKRLTLLAAILGSSIVFIDGSAVNVALPALRDDLDAGLATQQWVVEAYLLTLGALLLAGGSLGDIKGRRRVFIWGVNAFGVTSVLCALGPSGGVLIAARALQGIAGALLVPSGLALITASFDEDERGAAIGSWTAWTGVAVVIGPLVGGLLVDALSWRLVFAINVPLVLVTARVIAAVPECYRDEQARPVDWTGCALVTAGLGAPVFALIQQPSLGWGHPAVAGGLAMGALSLTLFALHERRTTYPLIPGFLVRIRNFAYGNLATFAIYAGLSGSTFLLGIFLQQVAGYSALAAGAVLLPVTILMFLLARRFGALADRIGPRLPMTVGPLVAAAGLALLLMVDERGDFATQVLPGVVVFGLGLSITVAPLTAAVLQAADDSDAGIASGINNAVARVSGLVAIAVIGTVVSASFARNLVVSIPVDSATNERVQAVLEDSDRLALGHPDSLASVREPERSILTQELDDASVKAFHLGIAVSAALVAAGGLFSAAGIRGYGRSGSRAQAAAAAESAT